MAWVLPVLGSIGSFIGANAGTIASGVGAAGALASTGTSIASAVKKPPKIPESLDERRSLLAQRLASGRTSRNEQGLASGGKLGDLSAAPIGKRTLLGG